ncbi:MAG: hypothetical protein AB7U97_05565 [Pirellulales bacterium]
MADLALAPEIEREARKVRESWSVEERRFRRLVQPALPATFASTEAIRAHQLRREFGDAPRPAWLKPFKLKPGAPEKPAKPSRDAFPIREMIDDIISRLTGKIGGAV